MMMPWYRPRLRGAPQVAFVSFGLVHTLTLDHARSAALAGESDFGFVATGVCDVVANNFKSEEHIAEAKVWVGGRGCLSRRKEPENAQAVLHEDNHHVTSRCKGDAVQALVRDGTSDE